MDRFLGFLGLAMKAGKVLWGTDAVEQALPRAQCLIKASDAGSSVERNARHLAEKRGIPLLCPPYTKTQLGGCIGKKPCALLSIADRNFAQELERIHSEGGLQFDEIPRA